MKRYDRPESAGIPITREGNAQWIDMLRSRLDQLAVEQTALSARVISNREDIVMLVGRDGRNGKVQALFASTVRQGERMGDLEKATLGKREYEADIREVRDAIGQLNIFKARTTAIIVVLASAAGVGGSFIGQLLGG